MYDYLIKNAKLFNRGLDPVVEDIAVKDKKIVARGLDLDGAKAREVIDGSGKWAMPGLFDIHTHYDLELELAPGLPESTRHGTTSVVIANCSLGLAFGAQRDDGADPIVDCYARVENIPKSVLKNCADNVSWDNPKDYLNHLETLNLGPNVVTLLPHSMLRIQTMGFKGSIERDPSCDEIDAMRVILNDAMNQGYVGLSTDALPFHYLANQPNTHKTIPTQFAKYEELKLLLEVVREKEGLWQATPPKDSVIETLKTFLLTSGRFHGKALKTTLVAALDVHNNFKLLRLARLLSKVLNSKYIDGKFYLQALGAKFKVYADGPIMPLAEEIPELRMLNELDLEDREGRLKLINNAKFAHAFIEMWMKGKEGLGISTIKRAFNLEDYAFNREMEDMFIESCPQAYWQGLSFNDVYMRVMAFKAKDYPVNMTTAEKDFITEDFEHIRTEGEFVLQMLRSFDTDLKWSTVSANRDLTTVRELLMDPLLLPGFNDSGAHLTNMAFYDGNLRSLQLAMQGGDRDVSYLVKRLTVDAAEVFGVDGGTLDIGAMADIILVDPVSLASYDSEANVQRISRHEFGHEQLVNRSDAVVPMVMIAGKVAWQNNEFSKNLGKTKMGQVLRAVNSQVYLAQQAATSYKENGLQDKKQAMSA